MKLSNFQSFKRSNLICLGFGHLCGCLLRFSGNLRFAFSDVNVAFQQAAHKVLLDDDNLLPLLHLTIDYQGKDCKGKK